MMPAEGLAALMVIGGYLLGAVPFGVVVAKCLGTVDPRTAGSRNVGFTNVLRVSGKKAGLLTLVGDAGKGWIVGCTAGYVLDREALVLVVAASPIVGHVYSVFLGFRGGKGVATAMGAVAGVAPLVGAALVAVWLLMVAVWRYSSGAAVAAFVALPVLTVVAGRSREFLGFAICVSALIVWRHKENVARLWAGREPKMGA